MTFRNMRYSINYLLGEIFPEILICLSFMSDLCPCRPHYFPFLCLFAHISKTHPSRKNEKYMFLSLCMFGNIFILPLHLIATLVGYRIVEQSLCPILKASASSQCCSLKSENVLSSGFQADCWKLDSFLSLLKLIGLSFSPCSIRDKGPFSSFVLGAW